MATLLKQRARKPVLEEAAVAASLGSGGYRLGLYSQLRTKHDYDLLFTRAEMLSIVSAWLGIEADFARRDDKAKRAVVSSLAPAAKDKPT